MDRILLAQSLVGRIRVPVELVFVGIESQRLHRHLLNAPLMRRRASSMGDSDPHYPPSNGGLMTRTPGLVRDTGDATPHAAHGAGCEVRCRYRAVDTIPLAHRVDAIQGFRTA